MGMKYSERMPFLDKIASAPDDPLPKLIYADRLDEAEEHAEANKFRIEASCLPELRDDDWHYTFAYAGEPTTGNGVVNVEPAKPGDDTPTTPFSRADVKRVIACQEGENDGPDWVCVGELSDGRFFVIRAGCDYTGWG